MNRSYAYGFTELREAYQKNMLIALTIAIIIQFGILCGYKYSYLLNGSDEKFIVLRRGPTDIIPPPPLAPINDWDPINIEIPKGNFGQIVPIIGMSVDDTTSEVLSQTDLSRLQDLKSREFGNDGTGNGNVKIEFPPDLDPKIDEITLYEKDPIIVYQKFPEYPPLARRAELEGKAYIKVLVGKDGKVKKAVSLKSDADIFVQTSIDAAMQYVFSPAIMNGKPIACWVALPFSYKLK